jgi:hypothetical protein
MYDEYARQLIEMLPDLPDIDRVACRRALSEAYFYVIRSKLGVTQVDEEISSFNDTQNLLRRMADALESVAVFDRLNGQEIETDVENACAFVAAESLAILGKMISEDKLATFDPLLDTNIYTTIEAALLYMIGGYDINAVSVVGELTIPTFNLNEADEFVTSRVTNAYYVLARIIALCHGDVRRPREGPNPIELENNESLSDYEILTAVVRTRFYAIIGRSLDSYLDWLGGYDDNGDEIARANLHSIQTASISSGYPNYTAFADIYHLTCLLIATLDRTSKRALIHVVPPPNTDNNDYVREFNSYLEKRARGDEEHRGRPFLWPSSMEFIRECLPGPSNDAVISMPTGSGKGYIAELAITHALSSGWVLYLAPTNALAHQIRHDLANALSPFTKTTVRAFVGNEEYTKLEEEQVNLPDSNFIAVMTPEKCALALRLYPEQFEHSSLCVFDECHLINDQNRGITADVLIAQLSMKIPNIRFMLMSAMVANSDELADWLNSIHKVPSRPKPLTLKWRPSRTLRGLLVVERDALNANYEEARKLLANLPERRINQNFDVGLAMIAGLSGPWTLDGAPDYRATNLPIAFSAQASKRSDLPVFSSWKNTSSRILSELFARSRIPAICFILSSRHHTFSNADKIVDELPDCVGQDEQFPQLIEAWLSISDAELGIETILRHLLRKGIAVHSSAMLHTEQAASEWMFRQRQASLMFATGTLAQGLNLPAVAVTIAGTSMGDPRDQEVDTIAGITRVNALILNSFGRAGRPGFSNQGIAVLVSDNPFRARVVKNLDPTAALTSYPVLGEPDAAIDISSPLEGFIDNILASEPIQNEATKEELTLTSLLAEFESDDYNSGLILSHTFAGYRKRHYFTPEMSEQARLRIQTIRSEFLEQPNSPRWMNRAAMISGVDFFHAFRMWQSYNLIGVVSNQDAVAFGVIDWLNIFFDVLTLLPPYRIIPYLPSADVKRNTPLTRMRRLIIGREFEDTIPWELPNGWLTHWEEIKNIVLLYLQGATYLELAVRYLNLSHEQITNMRSRGDHPIPSIFSFISNVIDRLAIDAGCFSAIQELIWVNGEDINGAQSPETLQALPLCIRNGCDSLGSLSWFRFGYRQRVCAHALEHAFPVPQILTNDSERAQWVRQTRRDWLSGKLVPVNRPILDHAKTVITETPTL